MNTSINMNTMVSIIIKYLIEGTAVAFVAKLVGKGKLKGSEVLTLGMTAAVVFLILDVYAPSVGTSSRTGAGLGIGLNTVGGLPMVEGMCNEEKEHFAPLHSDIGDYYSEYNLDENTGEYLYNMDDINAMNDQDKYATLHQLDISFRPERSAQEVRMYHQQKDKSGLLRHKLQKRTKGLPLNKLVSFAPTN